jgi:hypothetical protein
MPHKLITGLAVAASLLVVSACSEKQPGTVKDEAMEVGRTAASFPAADEDYYADMDYGYRRASDPSVVLNVNEVRGRNNWIVWTAGNDRFWDHMGNNTYGAFDLLKTISSHPLIGYCTEDSTLHHDNKYPDRASYKTGQLPALTPATLTDVVACRNEGKVWVPIGRDVRWRYFGLVNEPCFEKAKGPDEYGLWLDKRVPPSAECPADPFENETKYPGVKTGARGTTVPVGSYYGKGTGVVGLRLFPNPAFDAAAKKKWDEAKRNGDATRYYADPSFFNDKNLIRPYRIGMSCGFCHVGPNPSNPPADPENPKWANLNSNPGAQYFWYDRIFYWNPKDAQANFVFQLLHTSLPGTLDTSFVSTDNINNPRTMNAVYNVRARLEAAKKWREQLDGGQLDNKQFGDFPQTKVLSEFYDPATKTVLTPRVLKDGSDSVGVLGALNRVYINIGLFSEEWLLHFKPLVGGKPISPIRIADADKNSAYWQANTNQTPDLALFFLKTAQPDRLKDAPGGSAHLTTDQAVLDKGKTVFAENCARCHSSKQPANLCVAGQPCTSGQIIENSAEYFRWMRTEVAKSDFLDNNFLSTDRRIPITEMGINACSPLATNALRGNIWDNFSSETYKDLPAVGAITIHQPYSGKASSYPLAGGGRGYVRPASLVSVWSTAPFLQNNSVGTFSPDPSVAGRMKSFDDSIRQMLWPERRAKDPIIGDKVAGPSYIQRTTATSYLKVASGYLPGELAGAMDWGEWLNHWLPWLFTEGGDLQIGPIPKGTPVGLISNIQLLSETPLLEDKKDHYKNLFIAIKKVKRALKSLPANATDEQAAAAFAPLVDDLIKVSKCPDYIVNKGHYFGSNLGDDDKNALIEFIKTF